MSRRESREAAVKIIFQNTFTDLRLYISKDEPSSDLTQSGDSETMINTYADSLTDEEFAALDTVYIKSVLDGVVDKISSIDEYIVKYSKDWTIERMSKIDLAILRVAIYEILYKDDIPSGVSINEAVELAKKYSHKDAGSFINGILGSVYNESIAWFCQNTYCFEY